VEVVVQSEFLKVVLMLELELKMDLRSVCCLFLSVHGIDIAIFFHNMTQLTSTYLEMSQVCGQ